MRVLLAVLVVLFLVATMNVEADFVTVKLSDLIRQTRSRPLRPFRHLQSLDTIDPCYLFNLEWCD